MHRARCPRSSKRIPLWVDGPGLVTARTRPRPKPVSRSGGPPRPLNGRAVAHHHSHHDRRQARQLVAETRILSILSESLLVTDTDTDTDMAAMLQEADTDHPKERQIALDFNDDPAF